MAEAGLPIPDPTVLTTEALHREVAALREASHREVEALCELIESRMDGLDKVMCEKFKVVDHRFELIEKQRIEQKSDTKAAVDAALTAQKESVREQTIASERSINKSEASIKEQLSQLSNNFNTSLGGVNGILFDVKERVGKIENVKTGGQQMYGTIAGFVGLVMAIAAMLMAFWKR